MNENPISSPANPEPSPIPAATPSEKYKGVRGWLLLLCIGLTIGGPIRALAEVGKSHALFAPYFSRVPNLEAFWMTFNLINVGLSIYGLIVGIALWRVQPGAVRGAKRFLWCLLAFSVGALFLPILFGLPVAGAATIQPLGIFSFLIWFFYLKKSKRVKATYGAD